MPILLAAVGGVLALLDAATAPRHKRMVRLFEGCIAWYFVIIYALAWASSADVPLPDDLLFFLRSGIGTRFGVALLWVWIIVDVVASRRKGSLNV